MMEQVLEATPGATPGGGLNQEVKAPDNALNPTPNPEDRAILDLAKRRLSAKRNIKGQILDFFLIAFCLFLSVQFYDISDRLIVVFLFGAFWSVRLLVRVIKFVKPSLKDGIAAYFRERKEHEIESEYNRIKKKGPEYVFSELNR
jgi:hypothetical protein